MGYEINHAQRFVVRCTGSNQIGAYGVMFNKRALFIYRTNEECRGYSIRKSRWVSIIRDNHDLLDELEDQISQEYARIKSKVEKKKRKDLKHCAERADYDNIICITDQKLLMQSKTLQKPVPQRHENHKGSCSINGR